ncbi:MAG: hypothetical protein JSR28_19950 [Proteobacteria bacterium]|nr:hypothetical protein [Pseudomonadota bacterium]
MAKQQQRKAPKSKPITANPLFPAVVALWFGALFGLSSLALRVSMVENLVRASRIDLIVPAAAPPLGITARILIALGMAAVGAALGAAIGRRLARPKVEKRERKRDARSHDEGETQPRLRTRDSHPDAPARRPISAHEELGGEEPVDAALSAPAPAPLANRRRGLMVEHEPVSFVPHEPAPLPGGQPQILDLAGAELPPHEAVVAIGPQPTAPASEDLNAYADEEACAANEPEPTFTPAQAQPADDQAMVGRQVFGMAPVAPPTPAERQIFGVAPAAEDVRIDCTEVADLAPSVFEAPQAEPLFAARPTAPAQAFAAEPAPGAPLPDVATLGMTDLAVRLQQSMKRRRAARAAASIVDAPAAPEMVAPVAAPAPLPQLPIEAVASEPIAVPAAPAPFARTELPAALRPLSFDAFDEDDDDGDSLASLLPPRHIFAAPTPAPLPEPVATSEDLPDDEDEASLQGDYASLLGVAPIGGRTSFVRIEEPDATDDQVEPVVIFPGQAPRLTLGQPSGSILPEVAPVTSSDQADTAPFRRFDAPASAGQGQPVAASATPPGLDPEETERSLRAALASLQRISGAA